MRDLRSLRNIIICLCAMLTLGASEAWGYNWVTLKGNFPGSVFDDWNGGFTWENESGEGTSEFYIETNNQFKFYIDNTWCGGASSPTTSMNTGDAGYKIGGGNDFKYTGDNGIICFHYNQKTGGDKTPYVWLTRSTVYLKNSWNTNSWSWKTCTDENNGYYYVDAAYGASGANYGTNGNDQDGWAYLTATLVPSTINAGRKCRYRLNMTTWDGSNSSPTLIITAYYTISFNLNSHGSAIDAQEVLYNSSASTPSAPSETGYNFGGWYTNEGCTAGNEYNFSTPVTADITLYAKWTEKSYSITFRNDGHGSVAVGGEDVSNGSTASVNHFTTKTLEATNNTGYHFSSWTLSGTNTGNVTIGNTSLASTTIKATSTGATVTANFAPDTYSAANNLNQANGDAAGTYTATYDATTITINTTPTKTGYHVEGFYKTYTSSPSPTWTTLVATPSGVLQASTEYTNSDRQWTSTSNQTLYTKWTANSYQVRFNANGGTGEMSNEDFTYDAAKALTSNGFAKTGYHFYGWATSLENANNKVRAYTNGQSVSNLTATPNGVFDLYAIWEPNTYTVAFNANGGTNSMSDEGFTYDAAKALSTNTFVRDGYHFDGWATTDEGEKIYDDGESVSNLTATNGGTITLYAHWTKSVLTGLNFSPATVAGGNKVVVTPVISPSPTGTTQICYQLFANSSLTIPVISPDTFEFRVEDGNSVYFWAPEEPGTYYIRAQFKAGVACLSGTELNTISRPYAVASDHTITVKYVCDGVEIAASTEVEVPAARSAEVSAPSIPNYTFSEWVLSDAVTRTGGEGTEITIEAIYNGTLTAKYIETPIVYFYNNLGWSDVWVTYDPEWDHAAGQGAGNVGKTYHHMRQITGTDIWYDEVPEYYTNNSFEHWAWNIAFNSQQLGSEGYPSDYTGFDKGEAVMRYDFDPQNTLFVPNNTGSNDFWRNSTNYRSSTSTYHEKEAMQIHNCGYWKKYNKTQSGYSLRGTFAGIIGDETNWDGSNHNLVAENAIDNVFTTSLRLNANTDYSFRIFRNNKYSQLDNGSGYTIKDLVINQNSNRTNNAFRTDVAWVYSGDVTLHTATKGIYTFTVTFNNNGTLSVDVDFPDNAGEYQVLYSDNTTSEWFKSDAITGDNEIVSFFYRPNESPVLKWHKSTAVANDGTITWGSETTFNLSSYSSTLNENGVYQFNLRKNNDNLEIESVAPYTGNYYIRTDATNKYKWENYKDVDHQMTYSDYAVREGKDFSHYYMAHVNSSTNVKYVVANDYSPYISDTLIQQSGDLVSPTAHVDASGNIAAEANIRFMWNEKDNSVVRAYLAPAKEDGSKFLVLRGQAGELLDENGNALQESANKGEAGYNHKAPDNSIQFIDKENWLYETTVKIVPGKFVKLYAHFHDHDFYFKGIDNSTFDEENAIKLIDGTTGEAQKIRVIYDFKNDRLVSAWQPSTTISTETPINADVMLVRNHQEAGDNITFNSGGSLNNVKTVYGIMQFNRWTLSNRGGADDVDPDHCKDETSIATFHAPLTTPGEIKSEFERFNYFISFPFDVKLGDIFGFGTYGQHWALKYYDGKGRAEKGYWQDSESNWKYLTNTEDILHAYEGYLLKLSVSRMAYDNAGFWTNNSSIVELYFPSKEPLESIVQKNETIPALSDDDYLCTIQREGIDGDRRVKDSYWRCIGVPGFMDYNSSLSDGEGSFDWKTDNLPFLYEWVTNNNSLRPVSTNTTGGGPAYAFKAMHAYLIQNGNQIIWTNVSAKNAIVARRTSAETIANAEWKLTLSQGDNTLDQTFVRMTDDEGVTTGFDFGQDLSKELNSGTSNLYTLIGYERAAGNSLPMTDQKTAVPVGVQIAETGEYTFAIPEGTEGIGVVLVDKATNTRTNLSAVDYAVYLESGEYLDRFELEISPVSPVATGVGNTPSTGDNSHSARKVLIDGRLYIIREGKIYDAQGRMENGEWMYMTEK